MNKRTDNSKLANQSITFKPTPEMKAWLKRNATEGYRTVGAQVRMIVEAAMKAEKQDGGK